MCSIPGCQKKTIARGFCNAHYAKWKKYGDASVVRQVQIHGKTLRDRLEIYTKKSDGCWLWIGMRDANGYGRISVNGVPMLAHRMWWQSEHGDIGGKHVLHKCDNPQCVNPMHLFLGSHQDNMADMWAKGRARPVPQRGEAHGMAKVNAVDVVKIRAMEVPISKIAREFGVSKATIRDIRCGRTWKHVQ